MFETLTTNVHLPGILLAYSVLLVGICSPGPAVLAIIGTAMEKGRAPGAWLALGVVCGSTFWGVAAALGLSGLLSTYANVLFVVKIAGGLYLLWLAFKALKAAAQANGGAQPRTVETASAHKLWLTGLLIHLTNPKAIFAWLATIALGVTAASPWWVALVIVLGGIVISFVGNMAYAFLFSTERMSRLYLKAKRPIQYVFAAFFSLAGLKLLTSRT